MGAFVPLQDPTFNEEPILLVVDSTEFKFMGHPSHNMIVFATATACWSFVYAPNPYLLALDSLSPFLLRRHVG